MRIGIARQAIAQHFGINPGPARLGVFVFLQHHHTGALAHHKAVAVDAHRAGDRLGRVIVRAWWTGPCRR